jgi:hypothetical protein
VNALPIALVVLAAGCGRWRFDERDDASRATGDGGGELDDAIDAPLPPCSAFAFTAHPVRPSVGAGPDAIEVTDVNRDGTRDLLVANGGAASVSLLVGNGDGTFSSTPIATDMNPNHVVTGDWNADGHVDFVTANNNVVGTISVVLGDGAGGFLPRTDLSAGSTITRIDTGDLDNDGALDLVYSQFPSAVLVRRGMGDGTFSAPQSFASGSNPQLVTVVDLNGDEHDDVAVANVQSDSISVLLANTDGTLRPKVDYPTGNGAFAITHGDMDGDGAPDVVVTNNGANTVSVLRARADGTLMTAISAPVGMNPLGVAVGDFDRDGLLDVVTADRIDNVVSVLRGNGDGTLGPRTIYAVGTDPDAVTARDLDRDGAIDLAVANRGDNTLSILLGVCTL